MARSPELDQVALDARVAFKQGDQFFIAGQHVRPDMSASAGQARRGLSSLIATVEAEGWRVVNVEQVGAAAEVTFQRDEGRATAAAPVGGCLLAMVGLIALSVMLIAALWT